MNPTVKGFSTSPTYNTWRAMNARCYNPKTNGYHNYGGRGIKVCPTWRTSLIVFITDMGERPAGMVIERRDVNGDYTPDNCLWIPKAHMSRNQRRETVAWLPGESRAEHTARVHRVWAEANKERRKKYMQDYCAARMRHRFEMHLKWRLKNRLRRNEYQRLRQRAKRILSHDGTK